MTENYYYTPKARPQWVLDYINRNWVVNAEQGQIWSRTRKRYIGHTHPKGYVYVSITVHVRLKRSHVIWYSHYRYWPRMEIDH